MWYRSCLFAFLSFPLYSSGYAAQLDPALSRLLEKLHVDEQIDIIIDIKEKFDANSVRDSTAPVTGPALIRGLKETARQTQIPVLDVLKRHGITQFKQFWLSNKISATVPVSLISELKEMSAIGRLSLDVTVTMPKRLSSGHRGAYSENSRQC